jgi:hypothetical protein
MWLTEWRSITAGGMARTIVEASSSALDLYNPGLHDARARFARNTSLCTILDPSVDPDFLELFFIHFCAVGVRMTEPVEGWIRRAGERCHTLGLERLSRALLAHAKHEANHHLMMIEDTRTLVARRNARGARPRLDAESLLALSPPPGVRAYVALHERVIASAAPFGQLAIEYEIEALSVKYGAQLIQQVARVLGKDALAGLSFLEEHVAIDAGHTKFNEVELAGLLEEHPDYAPALTAAGSEALDAYGAFLDDCHKLARSISS